MLLLRIFCEFIQFDGRENCDPSEVRIFQDQDQAELVDNSNLICSTESVSCRGE